MPLSALPKTFGLPNLLKGMFPHLFNRRENWDYNGPLPAKENWAPHKMKIKDRIEFEKWYEEQVEEGRTYNFKEEIIKYCRDDVKILREACTSFRELNKSISGICPFSECTTLASLSMRTFRKIFLKENTIGIIPRGGYRFCRNQSKAAIEWLIWLEHTNNIDIAHAGKGREYRIPGTCVDLDGYYESPTGEKYAFQFQGCYWHGCTVCFTTERSRKTRENDSLEIRYEKTQATNALIREKNFILEEIWECQFNRMKKDNVELQELARRDDVRVCIPLNPREAFFGGRTGNIVSYYDCQAGERINYYDVCSLYPFICKTGVFPIEHPKIIVGEAIQQLCGASNDISNIEGLIKCQVLPPPRLFHPILPMKANNKLMFSLCKTCCEEMLSENCTHTDAERMFTGTWVSCELKKAVQMGYKIIFISEIWLYKTTQYNPATNNGGIFAGFINEFVKIKTYASGWPNEDRESYIQEIKDKTGIDLDPTKIEFNAGKRAVAKLMLNSLWGKFAQRANLQKTEIIKSYEQLHSFIFDPRKEVTGCLFLEETDDSVYLNWKFREEDHEISTNTNVVIAAYVTAQARLELYKYLEMLGERVLYYDTDSVIFVSRPGDINPPSGNALGEMTDELASYGVGTYISNFVSGGPKFYSYIGVTPERKNIECCKIKGIRIDSQTSEKVNYRAMRRLVVDGEDPFTIDNSGITREGLHEVVTRTGEKIVRITNPKRRKIGNTSVPYGFRN